MQVGIFLGKTVSKIAQTLLPARYGFNSSTSEAGGLLAQSCVFCIEHSDSPGNAQ